jgi:hypothetical protein
MNIDDHIRQAEQSGASDNLPGQGKPIRLNNNPYTGEQELAYDILQQARFVPGWIQNSLRLNQALYTYNLKAPPGVCYLIERKVERDPVKLRRLAPAY